jgi:TRAP-type transport system periplasmic protein
MKKFIFLAAIVILVVSLLGACSSSPPSPAPSPTTAPASSTAPAPSATSSPAPKPSSSPTSAAAKPRQLTVATVSAQEAWNSTHALIPWLKQITDATNGKVIFQDYFGGTLAPTADQWQAVQTGVADSSLLTHVTYVGVTPLADVMSLPFIPYKSHEQASGILWQIIDKFPSVAAEFKSTHLVTAWIGVSNILIATKKNYKTLDDWKGAKIRTGGGLQPQEFLALGAVPIAMPVTDVYLNLQKGVMDGAVGQWDFLYSYRLYELAKFCTYAPFSTSTFSFPLNNDDWNSFPQDIKDAFNKYGGLYGAEYWGYNMFDSISQQGPDMVKKAGFDQINYTVPADELDKWAKVAKPIWDKWVSDMNAKGHPEAQQILDTVLSLAKNYTPTYKP